MDRRTVLRNMVAVLVLGLPAVQWGWPKIMSKKPSNVPPTPKPKAVDVDNLPALKPPSGNSPTIAINLHRLPLQEQHGLAPKGLYRAVLDKMGLPENTDKEWAVVPAEWWAEKLGVEMPAPKQPNIKVQINEQGKPEPVTCELKSNGPGAFLHKLIKDKTGQDFTEGCGCCDFAKQMDQWGWLGCLLPSRITAIRDKMVSESKKRGAVIDADTGWRAFAQAARQMTT